ncbi:hypothetical protein CQ043_24080 [Paenibacillus sp. MYb63]|nr:hypothetical protein CQ043_24080 [Paenibacillus sp. MYb63]PRA45135.1 hypothetical protein CQ061_24035 [Paenibacillus sp. MYb67]
MVPPLFAFLLLLLTLNQVKPKKCLHCSVTWIKRQTLVGQAHLRLNLFKPTLKGPFGTELTPVHINHRLSEEDSLGLLIPVIDFMSFNSNKCFQSSILMRTGANVKMS